MPSLGGDGRVRLTTLTLTRWVAVGGQLFTILLVHFSLGVSLPLGALLPAVLMTALTNIGLQFRRRPATLVNERTVALLLAYDILQLTYLLAWTGALQNPFASLLILPVALAAATLHGVSAVVLAILALTCLAALLLVPTPLPWIEGVLTFPNLYLVAVWLALSLALILIAGFVWRVANDARDQAAALHATQLALAREQELSALGGQAAAVAHNLGSPLATIAIIARELKRGLPAKGPFTEEIDDLVDQVERCRETLAGLSQSRDDGDHERYTLAPLSSCLQSIVDEVRRPEIEMSVAVASEEEDWREPEVVLWPELRHAFANVIDNAAQFAHSKVQVCVDSADQCTRVTVVDDGPGFPPEVLNRIGEPYISTREGAGGLGLGIFIANALLARTGATLHFQNDAEGASVSITWPPGTLEAAVGERLNERGNVWN